MICKNNDIYFFISFIYRSVTVRLFSEHVVLKIALSEQ